ncbi:protein LONGIFOLIA 1 [Rhodamnia argentea]|uniref:Protein LONGIFOLIA 1 n=1 Tax=Rhodamnia argentea TaxID=178133 RepID=A0ABM3HKP8_9MYRT|nr:protein LONGIFOLIA 1 [Rhodamnia argentea]XP_048137168.1 protein LONGIFOLIA 1 [Rhodamnia argentea]XP_048137169.1 protein LONGIFOLIA 1 [Rhodamnia argentea]
MMTGIVQDQHLEKQIEKHIGCMAGFLHIFDRHQALAGTRLYAAKRLPPPTGLNSARETPKVVRSPAMSGELAKSPAARAPPSPDRSWPSPLKEIRSPAPEPGTPAARSPLPFPVFEFKEGTRSPWKFSKEAPRLSLDSRATTDAKGSLYPREIRTNASILSASRPDKAAGGDDEKQRRSPSVIARLMGLENLPRPDPEPAKKAELRRSASESRVNKDIYRFMEGAPSGFHVNQSQQFKVQSKAACNAIRENAAARGDNKSSLAVGHDARNVKPETAKASHRGLIQRKSFYDSTEFFPEPKQAVSIYEEIEKKLRMRGIDEPSKDLETLKQILEALQLKGLLHSKRNDVNPRNLVYERSFNDSPIVVMRPSRSSNLYGRNGSNSPPSSFRSRPAAARRSPGAVSPAASPRFENVNSQNRGRSSVSPTRSDNGAKSPSRRRPLAAEPQRRANAVAEQRRVSPVQSPRIGFRRTGPDQSMTTSQSPRTRWSTAKAYQEEEEDVKAFLPAEDESSTISESSISTPSLTDTERSKMEEYKEGKSLLERCDKLLHSIAEITAAAESQQQQPSPVSVLDSFYKDESSPSPVMKRSIEFEDQAADLDDDAWSPVSPISCKLNEKAEDGDYLYISDILRASSHIPKDSNLFLLLEKQQYLKGKDTSRVSRLQRRLIFDTVAEILDRKRHLLEWKSLSDASSALENPSLQQIWSEYQRIRERDTSDDLLEVICGTLRKDLAGDAVNGWDGYPVEMSEAAVDVERLVFKDLISETIRDLAAFASETSKYQPPRRKLVF